MVHILFALISCLTASGVSAADTLDQVSETDTLISSGAETVSSSEGRESVSSYDMWKHRRFIHIGYAPVKATSTSGNIMRNSFGIDFSYGKNIWLHRKPIAGMLKFGIDLGSSIGYTSYEKSQDPTDDGYDGPSGYLGDEPLPEGEDEVDKLTEFLLKDHGRQRADIGIVVGPSLTVNPVSDLRLAAYWHFIPSMSFQFINSDISLGWVPYMNYGLEVSYRWIGIGVERKYGIGNYWSLMSIAEGGAKTVAKYKLEGFSFYLAFRF